MQAQTRTIGLEAGEHVRVGSRNTEDLQAW